MDAAAVLDAYAAAWGRALHIDLRIQVYREDVRTNIELDDELLDQARRLLGTSTKKSTVEEALREVIRVHAMRELAALRLDVEDTRGPVSV